MLNYEVLALVGFAFLLGGLVKGVIGLGFPVVVLALLATTIGLKEAIALLIVPGIVVNLWQALSGGAFLVLLKRLWPLLITTVMGIWLGVYVLSLVDPSKLIVVLGVLLFSYAVFSLTRAQIPPPGKHEFWLSPLMGAIGGVVCGVTGSYLVPGAIYVQALGFSRDRFIQAIGIVFVVLSIALGISFWQLNLMELQSGAISVMAMVPLIVGLFFGQRLRYRLSEEVFRKVFFTALMLVGIYMVGRILL
jgi:uncharacterized protein